jgi:hypothetical protein
MMLGFPHGLPDDLSGVGDGIMNIIIIIAL